MTETVKRKICEFSHCFITYKKAPKLLKEMPTETFFFKNRILFDFIVWLVFFSIVFIFVECRRKY